MGRGGGKREGRGVHKLLILKQDRTLHHYIYKISHHGEAAVHKVHKV